MFSNMSVKSDSAKFRTGIFLIILWWIPFWALATPLSEKTGIKISVLTLLIMGIQTLIGVVGFFMTGKTVTKVIKSLPSKKVPGALFYMLIKGEINSVDNKK